MTDKEKTRGNPPNLPRGFLAGGNFPTRARTRGPRPVYWLVIFPICAHLLDAEVR